MRKSFKVQAWVLILVMLIIQLGSSAFAAQTNITRDDRAKILNELGILKGNGTSFDLNSKLRRSEAATFIVRLLGVEKEVLDNKQKYAYTSYKDVSPDEWYAPYVGYCDMNDIIDGYTDGTFKPNEYLSDKAFMKMLLCALDYVYSIDYSWGSVFSMAYQVGITKDITYKTKVDENKSYTRGDVVDAVYTTLSLPNNKTGVKMIQSFIDSGVISKEKAIAYGFIQDDVDTVITAVTAKSSTVIEVVFNEAIKDIDIQNIQIFRLDNTESKLTVTNIGPSSQPYSYLILVKENQEYDVEYGINITEIVDQYGNKQFNVFEKFLGFRPNEIKSDFFLISKVEPVSQNTINVYFTQPINENILMPNYFTIKKGDQTVVTGSTNSLSVGLLGSISNGVTINLKNFAFTSEETYELVVDGRATSLYGVQLKDGAGDQLKFKSVTAQSEPLALTKVTTLNSTTIKLDFNKVINSVGAEKVFNYYLTTAAAKPVAIQIDKAQIDTTTGKSVYLTTASNLLQNEKYNIMLVNIQDASLQSSITEKTYEFVSNYSVTSSAFAISAGSLDANTILVQLSRPLDEASVANLEYFQIYNVSDNSYIGSPVAVYYDKNFNAYSLKLYLGEGKTFTGYKKYELRVMPAMKDSYGNPILEMAKSEFNHNNSTQKDVYVSDVRLIGANTLKLTFNKEIALDLNNISSNNYSLTYVDGGITFRKTPISVTYIDPKTLILKFDSIDTNMTYKFSYSKLTSYGLITSTNTNNKYDVELKFGK